MRRCNSFQGRYVAHVHVEQLATVSHRRYDDWCTRALFLGRDPGSAWIPNPSLQSSTLWRPATWSWPRGRRTRGGSQSAAGCKSRGPRLRTACWANDRLISDTVTVRFRPVRRPMNFTSLLREPFKGGCRENVHLGKRGSLDRELSFGRRTRGCCCDARKGARAGTARFVRPNGSARSCVHVGGTGRGKDPRLS